MLVLTRKREEAIRIGGDITIKIVDVDNRQVKIGIIAPKNIAVNREEIYQRILAENKAAYATQVTGLKGIAEMLRGN